MGGAVKGRCIPVRFLAVILCLLTFSGVSGNDPVQKYLESVRYDTVLNQAQYGLYAAYLDEWKPVLDVNSSYLLAPASGLKLFTTAAALHVLGPDHRFETGIYYTEDIKKGTLQGNIYIVGGGDPTLGSDRVDGTDPLDTLMKKWTDAIRQAGIRNVTGSIVADNSLFDDHVIPDYWPWIDMGNYYAAGTDALSIHDNLYYLYFKPGKQAGEPARVLRTEPVMNGLTFINRMRTGAPGSGDNGYIYAAPRQYRAYLKGTVPAGGKSFSIKGVIPEPALFCAQYLKKVLLENGIYVEGQAEIGLLPAGRKMEIVTTRSQPLSAIVFITNKKSFNLYAEQLLSHLALAKGRPATRENGLKVLKNLLKTNNVPVAGMDLYDGSGLSRTNVITAQSMVRVLQFASRQSWFKEFNNSLAVCGDPQDIGYFKRFGRHSILEKNARVKSGTITGVRSLSGYTRTRSGKELAFSFICNNFRGSSRRVDTIYERLLVLLAEVH